MSNQLGLTLVITRQKLQPFVDEGVIYKDRKIVNKKKEQDTVKRKDAELEERVTAYRDKIHDCITYKRLFELEQVLNELTLSQDDNPDNMKIYKELRMNIIHGQICLASFFKWKQDQRQKQVNNAQKSFRVAMMLDAKDAARRRALKQLGPDKPSDLAQKIANRKRLKTDESPEMRKGTSKKLASSGSSSLQPPLTDDSFDQGTSTGRKGLVQILNETDDDGEINLDEIEDDIEARDEQRKLDKLMKEADTIEEVGNQIALLKEIIDENIGEHAMRK